MTDETKERIDIASEETTDLTIESLNREVQELKELVRRMKEVLEGILGVRL